MAFKWKVRLNFGLPGGPGPSQPDPPGWRLRNFRAQRAGSWQNVATYQGPLDSQSASSPAACPDGIL